MDAQQDFADLVCRTRRREEAAVAELREQFFPAARRAVGLYRRRSAEQARFDSEDIAQSAFFRLYSGLADGRLTFSTPDELAMWLVRTARNRLIDRLRHECGRGRSGRPREVSDGDDLAAAADSGPNPAEVAEAADLLNHVTAILPPANLTILRYWLEGRGQKEISQLTGQSPDVARKRLARVLDLLRRRLVG